MRTLIAPAVLALGTAVAPLLPTTDVDEPTTHAERAVAKPGRPKTDLARDLTRHPARILEFFGIAPGMKVADLMAGDGYYSELIAHIVGDEGRVISMNNETVRGFRGEAYDARFEREAFDSSNVDQVVRELDALELPDDLDRVVLIRFYHDFGWLEVDRAAFNRDIYASLKPGGVFCVVDHHSEDGAGMTVGGTLHRVEESLVRSEIEAAGFVLEAQSYVLADPTDPLDFNIFENRAARRDRTDRFVHFYRKPYDDER